MMAVTIILVTAAAAFAVAHGLRLPAVPLLILAGIGLTIADSAPAQEMLQNVLMLGLTFLVFAAGMELDPRRAGRQSRAAMGIGLVQFAAVGGAAVLAAALLGFPWITALYLGLAMSASSTIIVVRILRARRQFFEPFGRAVLGVLLLQDVLIILALSILSGVERGLGGAVMSLVALLGLGGLAWACAKWIAPFLLVKLKLDQEEGLIAALALLFAFVGLAHGLGLHIVIGAFLAGVGMSSFPVNGVVRGQVASLSNFFLAVFFVTLGAMLTLPSAQELLLVAALVVLVVVITPPLVVLVAERLGMSTRASIEAGLLLAQCSEFSIIVALLGVEGGYLDHTMLSVIALATVITMILTSFLATDGVTWRLVRLHPTLPRRHTELDAGPPPRDHILLLGCGSNSRVLLDLLLLHGHQVVVVDEDPVVVDGLRARGVRAVRGDGADDLVLRRVRAPAARVIISTMRRIEDNERMLRIVRGPNVIVRVFDDAEAARITSMGGTPAIEAEAAARALLKWVQERESAPRKEPQMNEGRR